MSAVIVCICNSVSDRQIRHAVKNGACSLRDLRRDLKVGACCGRCVPEAQATLAACAKLGRDAATPTFFPTPAGEFA